MNPKVSVVVPVYNTSRYLRQSLESLIHQTLREIEIIVVNDGSTDGSDKIIKEYAEKYKNIVTISKKNGGLASAYNAGQRVAKGEYVGFLDSDDWAEPNMFEALYNYGHAFNVDVVRSGGVMAETTGRPSRLNIFVPSNKCHKLILNPLDLPEFVDNHVCQWASIYKRDFLLQNKIEAPEKPKGLAPDIDFVYQVWVLAKSFYTLPQAFVHYRLDNPNSDKQSGSKMSFYLLLGHLASRKSLFKLGDKVSPKMWAQKTYVEFRHLIYEINTRSKKKRFSLIWQVSRLFKENLKKKLVDKSVFSEQDWATYRLIANHPILFYLRNITKFYKVTGTVKQEKTTWRYFGIYKSVEREDSMDVYLFGNLIFRHENLRPILAQLDGKLNELNQRIATLSEQVKRGPF